MDLIQSCNHAVKKKEHSEKRKCVLVHTVMGSEVVENQKQTFKQHTEGPCLIRLLVLEKICISQNSHKPNICLMRFFGYLFHYCDLPNAILLAIFVQKITLMK